MCGRGDGSDAATSRPVHPGIWMSRNTTSGASRAISLHRLFAVLRLADDFDVGHFRQQTPQPLARRLLVVHEQRANLRGGQSSAHLARRPASRSSSAGRSGAELVDVGERRLDDLPRRQRRVPAEDGDQALDAKLPPVRRGRFGQAVGVDRQHVAGGERDRSFARTPRRRTSRRPAPVASSIRTPPVRREHDGRRVAGVGVGQRGGPRIEGAEEDASRSGSPRSCRRSAGSVPSSPAGRRARRSRGARRDGLHARLHRSGEQPGIHALARHVAERRCPADRCRAAENRSSPRRRRARARTCRPLEAGFSGRGRRHQPHLRADGFAPLARGALLLRYLDANPLDGPRQAGRGSPASAGSPPRAARTRRRRTGRRRCRTRCAAAGPAAARPPRDPRAPGIWMSRNTRSGARASMRETASRPSSASPTISTSRVGRRQQPAQPVARRRLVVHDERADHRTCPTAGCGRGSCAHERQRHRHGRPARGRVAIHRERGVGLRNSPRGAAGR